MHPGCEGLRLLERRYSIEVNISIVGVRRQSDETTLNTADHGRMNRVPNRPGCDVIREVLTQIAGGAIFTTLPPPLYGCDRGLYR